MRWKINGAGGPYGHGRPLAATALVEPAYPGDWTQAVMELGATICLPQTSQCPLCPLNDLCRARQQGLERDLPLKPTKKPLPHYDVTGAIIYQDSRVLIAQRPPKGMLGGLWEFPGGKREAGESLPDCLRHEIREELGVEIAVDEPLVTVKHSYTPFQNHPARLYLPPAQRPAPGPGRGRLALGYT